AAADVVIDGVLGIGGRPGQPPAARAVFDLVPDEAWLVAVDLPSGADPSGQDGNADRVLADETVTFGVAKPVHLLPATESAVGRLTVVDIGLRVDTVPAVQRLTHDDAALMWPVPGPGDDKYSRGVLGVVAGGEHYTGAALLSVTSVVCSGVGMVRYVGPPTPTALVRAQVPEAVMGAGRVQAWVVGPGLDAQDDSEAGRAQVAAAREALGSGEPCVVDAGALDLIEGVRSTPTLLTPHAGELARLLGRLGGREVTREQVGTAPVAHARELAGLTGCTVLLKGSTTLVVPPGSSGLPIRSQADAPAWLATAGSGDVLAGLAGTLLAAGIGPLDAGSLAALVHGLAGHAANPGGPVRALAVAHGIPGVVAGLLERPTGRA
ncbi:MAG: bifunctional ADP-dependent NAD(P)H-hydrate dehydratase/NAD(P)H-hydrate epimerase, partial [Oryzihumus sp.]